MADLPPRILELQEEIKRLHRAHPTLEMAEAARIMVQQLHIAVHGDTWARPQSPANVWLDLLAKVRTMAADG